MQRGKQAAYYMLWAATFNLVRLISERKACVELGHSAPHIQNCIKYKVVSFPP